MLSRDNLLFWSFIGIAVVAGGLLYTLAFQRLSWIGPVYFLAMASPIAFLERGRSTQTIRDRLNALSTPALFISKVVVYNAVFFVSCAGVGTILWLVSVGPSTWSDASILPLHGAFASLCLSAVLVFIIRIRDLVGHENFTSLMLGTYRLPVEEDRIFLVVDLIGSTRFSDQHGGLQTMLYLRDIFAAIAEPVQRYRGAIHDYIGDAVLITWHLQPGIRDGACLRCLVEILDAVNSLSDTWTERFGAQPGLRLVLHSGRVTVGEIGRYNTKITFFGDAINTVSRMEQICKQRDARMLISRCLLRQLPPVEHIAATDVGRVEIKGRSKPLEVLELHILNSRCPPLDHASNPG
ncbi:adenylate/guanylate cyclase domain-containing protein [Ensifer sp. YR511]|uniref:adenylate/guanylate cyclase domain-containing protein n=1 Tax=Ensifer sp. YR511 TaxID=1855294 RepID=UPI0008922413|nr:adenylate/guanylate cyclase domain-containing protein [Ensifer sp. YR511]SDN05228.1 adenylate cyclase [Ensifer sp. YR511]